MKCVINLLLCCVLSFSCSNYNNLNLRGETTYTKQKHESLSTRINLERKHIVYEPKHKRYAMYVTNKIVVDVDHFGNDVQVKPYTTFELEF